MQTHRLAIELNSSADLSKSTPDGDEDLFLRHGPSSPADPSDRLRSFSRRDHIDGRAAGFAPITDTRGAEAEPFAQIGNPRLLNLSRGALINPQLPPQGDERRRATTQEAFATFDRTDCRLERQPRLEGEYRGHAAISRKTLNENRV
jgi:hypothetical protein